MRPHIWACASIATLTLTLPFAAVATEPAATGASEPAVAAPTSGAPAAAAEAKPAPAVPAPHAPAGGARFDAVPARGIQPTVSRLPTYWQCQDNLDRRLVVTYLDTKTPSVVLERGGKKIMATLQRSGSGSKWMAPGGILFWERGKEATLQWGGANAASCTSLGS